jgi:hypothetical protein
MQFSFSITVAMLLIYLPSPVHAHDFNGMSTHIVIGRSRITAILRMVTTDAAVLSVVSDADGNGWISCDEMTKAADSLTSDIASRFLLTNNGRRCDYTQATALIASLDSITSQPHEIAFTVTYRLPDRRNFEKVHLNPNVFRPIEGRTIPYRTPTDGGHCNKVTIIDCETVTFEAKGSETYDTSVGNCE